MDNSDITDTDLQDEIITPNIFEKYREQVRKRMEDDQYMHILSLYVSSVFQNFESFLGTEVYLIENDTKLVLDEYNLSFATYELEPGIYTFKDLSEGLFNIPQPEY